MIVLQIDRGDRLTFTFIWPDANGAPANLTGWTLDAFDATAELVGLVTPTFISAALGQIRVNVSANRTLTLGITHTFRIGATPPSGAADGEAFPLFGIEAT